MQNWLILKALAIAIPAILGPLTYIVARYVLNLWEWLDAQNAGTKRALVFAIALGLAGVAQASGIALPAECSAIGTGELAGDCQSALANPVWLKGILGALVAYAMHALKKAQPNS